jgi:hypothetical protein
MYKNNDNGQLVTFINNSKTIKMKQQSSDLHGLGSSLFQLHSNNKNKTKNMRKQNINLTETS